MAIGTTPKRQEEPRIPENIITFFLGEPIIEKQQAPHHKTPQYSRSNQRAKRGELGGRKAYERFEIEKQEPNPRLSFFLDFSGRQPVRKKIEDEKFLFLPVGPDQWKSGGKRGQLFTSCE